MSFVNSLMNGHDGGLKPDGMTPMQKIALRFVVLGVLFYGVAAVEGMMMRVVEITPVAATTAARPSSARACATRQILA